MKQCLLFFLFPLFSFSQNYASLDSFALNIPDSVTYSPPILANYITNNFTKTDEKVRVLYVWITTEIQYEEKIIDSLKNDDLVIYSLKTKSGICKNYSALLTSLCKLMQIEAYSILGYTKIKSNTERKKDHAWNIIRIDKKYYLFDPTWDAKLKKYNPTESQYKYQYYKKDAAYFIETHMPYDPMMQLKYSPITHKEFFLNKTSGNKQLDFKKCLANYKLLSEKERLQVILKRAEEYQINIPELAFLYKRLKYFVKNP